jgi:hypothetical protein
MVMMSERMLGDEYFDHFFLSRYLQRRLAHGLLLYGVWQRWPPRWKTGYALHSGGLRSLGGQWLSISISRGSLCEDVCRW